VLVGKGRRSRRSPRRRQQYEAQNKDQIDIRPSMPTFLLKSQQVCGARWKRA
jgi:hypothetical protein